MYISKWRFTNTNFNMNSFLISSFCYEQDIFISIPIETEFSQILKFLVLFLGLLYILV